MGMDSTEKEWGTEAGIFNLEEDSVWWDSRLIFSLQNKSIDIQKKVDLAFDYVSSINIKRIYNVSQGLCVIKSSRTLDYLNNWVLSILIDSAKKTGSLENRSECETSGLHLDLRCWKILHFCLDKSKDLHISLSCSKEILRVVCFILKGASSDVDTLAFCCDGTLSDHQLEFYDHVTKCTTLIFSFHGGVVNENVDSWIILSDKLLEVALKIVKRQLDGSKLGNIVLQLSCYLLEPFAKFLQVHPMRKNGYRDFIDTLLEPLLLMLYALHLTDFGNKIEWGTKLYKLTQDVLAQGLFHTAHVDGFLSLQSTVRFKKSSGDRLKEEKLINESYHRHLFNGVENIVKRNNLALVGLGELLHLFVDCATKHRRASVSLGSSTKSDVKCHVTSNTAQERENPGCHAMNSELRNSIFNFFGLVLNYILADLNSFLQSDRKEPEKLLGAPNKLLSINNLLAIFIEEKVYLRTEDISDGGSRKVLRVIYDMVMTFSAKITHQDLSYFSNLDERSIRDLLVCVRKELIVMVHHLLNLEYDVVGDDLKNVWIMVFTTANFSYGPMDVLDQPLLFSKAQSLGCRLIDLYGELRQVNTSISALCKAVRLFVSGFGNHETCAPYSYSSYSSALKTLLCSLEFRLSLCSAIKTMPEGQSAECIQQLSSDIVESLEWIDFEHQLITVDENSKSILHGHDLMQAEILGRAFSEVYIIIVDSITVTYGNSYLLGISVKNIIEIITSRLSGMVSLRPFVIKEFSIVVDERDLVKSNRLKNESMCYILLLFSRLLLSCRSLYGQVISFMPPKTSKKMSRLLGHLFTSHSGRDWLELSRNADKDSCILQSSSHTFLDAIRSLLEISVQDSSVLCPSLVYVLSVMAILKLIDLNRFIQSYVSKLKGDSDLYLCRKREKKWIKYVSKMREEAAHLTEFMMEILMTVAKDLISAPSVDGGINDKLIQCLHDNDLSFAVGSIDERSLPCALWWIICRNVDVWAPHAAKKDVKKFLSLLVKASISWERDPILHDIKKHSYLKKVTVHWIALEFLSNTFSYEHRFVWRYMASRFCSILQKSVASFLTSEVDLRKSPEWDQVISELGDLSATKLGLVPETQPNMTSTESCDKQTKVNSSTCQHLLDLLMRMPEDYLSSQSSSLYITSVLNLERLLVRSLSGTYGSLCKESIVEIVQLFVICRRVLKNLTAAFYNEYKIVHPKLISKLPECPFPLSWLLVSLLVVTRFQLSFPNDVFSEGQAATCSLIDLTSYALQTVSRDVFGRTINDLAFSKCKKRKSVESDPSECIIKVNHHERLVAWKSFIQVADALEEHMRNSLANFGAGSFDKNVERVAEFQELNSLSSITACFQGLIWGLISALETVNVVESNFRRKFSACNAELIVRVDFCVHKFIDFMSFYLKVLFLEDDSMSNITICGNKVLGARESLYCSYDSLSDASKVGECHPAETVTEIKDNPAKRKRKRDSDSKSPNLETLMRQVQHVKHCRKKDLFLKLLTGENTETSLFVRQLFLSCSAILRLSSQVNLDSLPWGWFPIVVSTSENLLLEFSSRSEMPHQFAFLLLGGAVKFLRELGCYFSNFDPLLSRDSYLNLIGLHLRAIGKCISLQRKEARIASRERGPHVKMLINTVESNCYQEISKIEEFKTSLRMSLSAYIMKSSELHLLSAIQVVEGALVGIQEGLLTNYEIVCGNSDGGYVSSYVAAGIECLDLILECVKGKKHLSIIKKHIQSLVSCLFNIILHLQAPEIFLGVIDSSKACTGPDPGSVVLMCIEVLTKIYGQPLMFQMEACHIAESLRVPAPLFQYFLHQHISYAPNGAASGIKADNSALDIKFSVELYSACCRLLCTSLKHHKMKTRQLMALLEDSVAVLLHSLEIAYTNPDQGRVGFAWGLHHAVKCASSLRRVYEEVRQQKDVFGKYAFQLLCRYIWVYCGFGAAKKGITSDVDEALKPGVYALVDCCSADDLQLLHTVYGEGPCRSFLATLQHDYKLYFQFHGKV